MTSGRLFLLGLGLLSAVLILGQLAMGQMIVMGKGGTGLVKAHQHSGYTTVLLSFTYILLSLRILSRRS
jgi:hypothetical protein